MNPCCLQIKFKLLILGYKAYTKLTQFNLLAFFFTTSAQTPDNLSTLDSLLFPRHNKHFAHVLILSLPFLLGVSLLPFKVSPE